MIEFSDRFHRIVLVARSVSNDLAWEYNPKIKIISDHWPYWLAMYRLMANDCGIGLPSTNRTGIWPNGVSARDQRSETDMICQICLFFLQSRKKIEKFHMCFTIVLWFREFRNLQFVRGSSCLENINDQKSCIYQVAFRHPNLHPQFGHSQTWLRRGRRVGVGPSEM